LNAITSISVILLPALNRACFRVSVVRSLLKELAAHHAFSPARQLQFIAPAQLSPAVLRAKMIATPLVITHTMAR
jgi:hypothetical protein